MKQLKLALIVSLLFMSSQIFAQNSGGHYETDYLGRKVWVGDNGTKGTYDKDYLGRTTYEDNNGTKGTYDKDDFSIYRAIFGFYIQLFIF
jgi:hypothetical protein